MIKLNGEPINITVFPDQTDQVWQLSKEQMTYIINNSEVEVEWHFDDPSEIFQLCQLSELVNAEYYLHTGEYLRSISIYCPYLPYARQDKKVTNETSFALVTMMSILGEYFDKIISFDIHPTKHENFPLIHNICPSSTILKVINHVSADYLVFPDLGAKVRYEHLFDLDSITLKKVRDQTTGNIIGLDFIEMPPIITDKNILIVDDIADGAKTHIETAKLLKAFRPSSINLYVSHGLFTKGRNVVYESGIDNIFTKESIISEENNVE